MRGAKNLFFDLNSFLNLCLISRRGLRVLFRLRFDFEMSVGVAKTEIVVAQKNLRGFYT
jgi:hypothetical protein